MTLTFNYAARSDVGMVRSDNQDSGYAGHRLVVVADGMGGHAGGDRASAAVISHLIALDDDSPAAGAAGEALITRIAAANQDIGDQIALEPAMQGMGTTVTAILRSRNKLAIAHIGDSRCYLLRGETFTQITHDHSFVQTLIDSGEITEEEASTHPQRSLVTRVLTGGVQDEPDLTVREAVLGDRYLLCSDGVSGFVAADTLEEQLRQGDGPGATADALIDLALKAGAPDNATVVIADIVDATKVTAPTEPQIVGAASAYAPSPRAASSPAAKAAALTRPPAQTAEQPLHLAEDHPAGRARLWRIIGSTIAALTVLAAGIWVTMNWINQQYYIGAHNGTVALYRGISGSLGPIQLSSVVTTTTTKVDDLPDFYRQSVTDTISASKTKGEELLTQLAQTASECQATQSDNGQSCLVEGRTSTPAPSPSTKATPSRSPSSGASSTAKRSPSSGASR